METKICSKCKVEKDICEYHKDKNKKDGLNTYCKLCAINHSKEYYEKNKEKINEKSKTKITCECGCEICKDCLNRHMKSKKHIDLMSKCLKKSYPQ